MTATQAHLEAVLKAAEYLLGARQDQMLTIEEWVNLARAVAAANGRKTAEWLTERDVEDIAEGNASGWDLAWNEEIDGPLPDLDED